MEYNKVELIENTDDSWTLVIQDLFKDGNKFVANGPTKTSVIQQGLEMAADRINILGNLIDELKRKL